MPSVEAVAAELAQRGRKGEGPVPTWPPLEPLKDYYIRGLRLSLLDRLKILAVRMHRKPVEVVNLVIEAGLDALERGG